MSDLEFWHVQCGAIVKTMSLDELDNAFQSGMVDENTMVLKAGSTRWMTLAQTLDETPPPPSEVAESYDAQPNSIAPFATDIASSRFAIPSFDTPPSFDPSPGTEELAVFKPKRRVGRALAMMVMVAMVGGGLFAVKSYGTANLKAKASSIASLVKGIKAKPSTPDSPMAAAAMQAPAPATDLPPAKTVNINSLPAVGALAATNPAPPPPDKSGKTKKTTAKPGKAGTGSSSSKKANANDPTQKGVDQFDPLNGKI